MKMAISKQTIVDQIEVTQGGVIQVRMKKLIVEDGSVLSESYHRTSIEPNGDCEAQLTAVNAHLEKMNCAAVTGEDWARVKRVAQAAWTA